MLRHRHVRPSQVNHGIRCEAPQAKGKAISRRRSAPAAAIRAKARPKVSQGKIGEDNHAVARRRLHQRDADRRVVFCHAAQAGPAVSSRKDGSLEIAGRAVQCGNVRTRLDRNLPGLGAAAPSSRLLILNPTRLQREPDNVRLFVFYHECGHHHVGASELQADSWAVNRGVREGWLDKAALKQVCTSFGGMPETATHRRPRAAAATSIRPSPPRR